MSGLSPERLAEIEARDARNPEGPVIYNSYGQIVWEAQDRRDLLAEVKRLRAQAENYAVCRRANSSSARALMDAIRGDPAFPPDDDPALFGERALAVINRLRAQRSAVEETCDRMVLDWRQTGERTGPHLADAAAMIRAALTSGDEVGS